MDVEKLALSNDKNAEVPEKITPKLVQDTKDWRDRFLEKDLLSPIYIFVFIVLFKDGKDGIDLHDAIIRLISSYNGQ